MALSSASSSWVAASSGGASGRSWSPDSRIQVFQEPASGSIIVSVDAWPASVLCGLTRPNAVAIPAVPMPRRVVRRETRLRVMARRRARVGSIIVSFRSFGLASLCGAKRHAGHLPATYRQCSGAFGGGGERLGDGTRSTMVGPDARQSARRHATTLRTILRLHRLSRLSSASPVSDTSGGVRQRVGRISVPYGTCLGPKSARAIRSSLSTLPCP